jgi:hypothetical protein
LKIAGCRFFDCRLPIEIEDYRLRVPIESADCRLKLPIGDWGARIEQSAIAIKQSPMPIDNYQISIVNRQSRNRQSAIGNQR